MQLHDGARLSNARVAARTRNVLQSRQTQSQVSTSRWLGSQRVMALTTSICFHHSGTAYDVQGARRLPASSCPGCCTSLASAAGDIAAAVAWPCKVCDWCSLWGLNRATGRNEVTAYFVRMRALCCRRGPHRPRARWMLQLCTHYSPSCGAPRCPRIGPRQTAATCLQGSTAASQVCGVHVCGKGD